MKIFYIIILATLPFTVFSQKNKVQGAWRALSDYESTLNDNPDVSYLLKAKESIDLAAANEETSNQVKTYAYRFRIYINLFSQTLKAEEKKLTDIADKNERLQMAYGNVDKMKIYEDKAIAIDPKAFRNTKD